MKKNMLSFKLLWSALMVVAYLGISYLVMFTPLLIRYNSTNNNPADDQNKLVRIILAIVLFVYGILRGYRLWKSLKELDTKE